MANVYELGNSFDEIWNMIEDEVMDEETLDEVFNNLVDDTKDKLENCCKYIKNTDSDIEGIDAEIKRLQAKKKTLINSQERLKDLMMRVLVKMGEKKLPCGTFTVSRQSNPAKLVMDTDSLSNIPVKYLKFAEPSVERSLIKQDLENGVEGLDGIAHLEKSEGIRIR